MGLTPEQKMEMDKRHPNGAEWRRESPPTAATKALKAEIRKEMRTASKAPPTKPAPTIAKTSAKKPPAVIAEFRIDPVAGLVANPAPAPAPPKFSVDAEIDIDALDYKREICSVCGRRVYYCKCE
jgi:hypothetical protein